MPDDLKTKVLVACAQRGWKLGQLARLAGIDASDLSKKLRGMKPTDPAFRRRLEETLKLPTGTLA